MSNVYEDSDWSDAMPTGAKRWLRPFPGINTNFIYEQDYTQSLEDFLDDEVAIGEPHEDDPTFFMIEESTPTNLGGGMVRFTRTYSQIPPNRTEYESFAFTFPGIELGVLYAVNSVTGNTGTTSGGTTTLAITGGDAIAVGDTCQIKYNAFDQVQQYTRYVTRTALTGTGGGSLVVSQIVDSFDAQPLYFWWAQKIEIGREPRTETVASFLTYEYFFGGDAPGDITLSTKEIIIDADGLQTDTYSATTQPSAADYRETVAGEELIVAEDSVVRRWRGPILEKVTRYVKAK